MGNFDMSSSSFFDPNFIEAADFEDRTADYLTRAEPYDPKCGRYARDMTEYDSFIADGTEGIEVTPDERAAYVREEEGTYNPENGHFLCDKCYIDAGMPSGPRGWKCP